MLIQPQLSLFSAGESGCQISHCPAVTESSTVLPLDEAKPKMIEAALMQSPDLIFWNYHHVISCDIAIGCIHHRRSRIFCAYVCNKAI